MMPEPAAHREIVVPGDMRVGRSRSRAAARRPAAPVRPRGATNGFGAAAGAALRWAGGLCLRRPGETAGSLVALGAAAYISLNALGFQEGRHPAPILPQAARVAPALAAAMPSKPLAAKPAGEQALREAHENGTAKETASAAPRDGIGAILRDADETTASVSPRPDKPDKDVTRAQRALSRLGYGPLKDDGVMGPGTRAALERFERERKLPIKGEASGRTLRELVALADKKKG